LRFDGENWPPRLAQATNVEPAKDVMAKNYYVIFDESGSMNETDCADGDSKSNVAKKALSDFAKALPADANLGLLTFGQGGIQQKVSLAVDNRSEFMTQVYATDPSGNTPLKDSVVVGVAQLADQARRQSGYGEYHLVIITDGNANPSDQEPSAIVRETLFSSPIVIHTIGFCIEDTHSLNQPGHTLYYPANNPKELTKGLGSVLAEAPDFNVDEFK
jgi:uncharacterized protein with von Willebrand factor type A (vWA) domain